MVKKSFRKKILKGAVVASAMAAVVTATMPAHAGTYSTEIGGVKTTSFDSYLVMDKDANVPKATLTYAVTAGTAKTYTVDGDTVPVLAGVDADAVTVHGTGDNTIAYQPGDTVFEDENALIKGYDASTKKYVKKTATLDFSACHFTQPGIYRYVLTESGTNQAVTNDAETARIVDVYVEDDSVKDDLKLKIAGYVLHSSTEDVPDATLGGATKSQGFSGDYDSSDITFKKEVTGNQASHNKYFKFTVAITGAVPGTVYDVDLTKADTQVQDNAATADDNKNKTNVTRITVGEDGTATQDFYLQHGQEIRIEGISKDTSYAITENAEEYKSTAAGVSGYTGNTDGTIASTDVKTSYLNTKNGVIPTGVVMNVTPFAVATLLAGIGAVTIVMRKKKNI